MNAPPERRTAVREWLALADADHDAAKHLQSISDEKLRYIIGFHVQQAIEKWIKAILTEEGIDFPRTHDLTALLSLSDVEFQSPISQADLERISDYAVTTRYPMPDDPPSEADITDAVISAAAFASAMRKHLAHYFPLAAAPPRKP
ncbi:MAG: HEPN domain-containing protein [Gemmatimonadota bacterium]